MRTLCRITTDQEAIRALFRVTQDSYEAAVLQLCFPDAESLEVKRGAVEENTPSKS